MTNRRHFLQRLLAAGFANSLPGAIGSALAASDKPLPQGIVRMNGKVTVNSQTASQGMLIRPGDSISTGLDTETVYVIGQDAFLQRANSTVNFMGETFVGGLRIVSGKLLAVFGKQKKTIYTSVATIGIRGTGCYIEAATSRMYICLCYGEADFTPAIAPEKAARIVTLHHESPVWISGENHAQPISKAPMINHSDAELALLESLVGRSTPFESAPGKAY
ncbi:MAG: hypothetical protein H6R18_631 [Proteobacteria bacterium]|nr:hypothetical protein [Pseudomonadota bacterium]